jgi:hypothetical protein
LWSLETDRDSGTMMPTSHGRSPFHHTSGTDIAARPLRGKGRAAPPVREACDKITCRCWGNPNAGSKEILAGFGATYEETAKDAFVLNPKADRDSKV